MKKIFKDITILAALLFAGSACTNLDEKVYSQIPKEDFMNMPSLLSSYAARPYTLLQKWGVEQGMWTMIMQLSNEVAVPLSWNGSWGEARYGELQSHAIPTGNKLVRTAWQFCFNGIAACNDVLYELGDAESAEGKKVTAEIKLLRAYYYYLATDCWGNVPYSVNKMDKGYPEQKDRTFMFDFLKNEITENMPYLDEADGSTYGRVTKDMAQFLLAKLYMSAKDWLGEDHAMWKEAGDLCKQIMDSHHFSLTPTYKANFSIHNETSTEAIFAEVNSSVYTKEAFYPFAITLNSDLAGIWKIGDTWNGTFIGQPDFMATYDSADTRKHDTWLFGDIYDLNGRRWQYHENDADGNPVLKDYSLKDTGIDESKYKSGIGRLEGARIQKWEYQGDGTLTTYQVSMENDFILFRYSDAVLMYVECLLRQDKVAEAVAVPEFQQIRTRAGLAPFTAAELNLENFYWERAHEMAIEGWERQDLIRFGKYLDKWWAKPAGNKNYLLLPIPEEMRGANPNLQPNPGYTR